MTALGLARASDSLAAGVDYAGVHNWASFLASVGLPAEPGDASQEGPGSPDSRYLRSEHRAIAPGAAARSRGSLALRLLREINLCM
jgi:hypothetical protein